MNELQEPNSKKESVAIRGTALFSRLLGRALDMGKHIVFMCDHQETIFYANSLFAHKTTLSSAGTATLNDFLRTTHGGEILLANARAALSSTGLWQAEYERISPTGERLLERITILIELIDGQNWYVAVAEDLSELRTVEEHLQYSTNHDTLTGLPNREFFCQELNNKLKNADPATSRIVVCVLDLDNFKHINNDESHEVGDAALIAVAKRLSETARPGDIIARTGGDEFSSLMPIRMGDDPQDTGKRILCAFDRPFEVRGRSMSISSSLGLSVFPDHGDDAATLLGCADMASQVGKNVCDSPLNVYRDGIDADLRAKSFLEKAIRLALGANAFSVHYQPVVDLLTGDVEGVEALARWRHAVEGTIPPSRFIPAAEESGLIGQLGEYIFRAACIQGALWNSETTRVRMAINVSSLQLHDPRFLDAIRAILSETGMVSNNVTVEITESSLCEDLSVAARLVEGLRNLGLQVSVDDFGTGYSSLAYLKSLPVNVVKIDREFVRDMDHDIRSRRIVDAVVDMAHAMGVRVIAEGIENATQLDFLRQTGCDFGQGFLFGKALPADQFEGLFLTRAS